MLLRVGRGSAKRQLHLAALKSPAASSSSWVSGQPAYVSSPAEDAPVLQCLCPRLYADSSLLAGSDTIADGELSGRGDQAQYRPVSGAVLSLPQPSPSRGQRLSRRGYATCAAAASLAPEVATEQAPVHRDRHVRRTGAKWLPEVKDAATQGRQDFSDDIAAVSPPPALVVPPPAPPDTPDEVVAFRDHLRKRRLKEAFATFRDMDIAALSQIQLDDLIRFLDVILAQPAYTALHRSALRAAHLTAAWGFGIKRPHGEMKLGQKPMHGDLGGGLDEKRALLIGRLAEGYIMVGEKETAFGLLRWSRKHVRPVPLKMFESIGARLGRQGEWQGLVRLTKMAPKHHDGEQTAYLLISRIRAYIKLQSFHLLCGFLDQFAQARPPLDPPRAAFRLLLQGHLFNRDLQQAGNVLKQFRERGHSEDEATYVAILRGYRGLGRQPGLVRKVLEDGDALGLTVDARMLNAILDLCAQQQDRVGALEVLRRFDPFPLSFTKDSTFVSASSTGKSAQRVSDPKAINSRDPRRTATAPPPRPDVETYTIIIRMCSQVGDCKGALDMFEKAAALCLEQATQDSGSSVAKDGEAKAETHTWEEKGKWKEEEGVPRDRKLNGPLKGLDRAVAAVVKTFINAGRTREGLRFVTELCERPTLSSPATPPSSTSATARLPAFRSTSVIFSVLLEAALKQGSHEDATRVLARMRAAHVKPDAATLNVVLRYLSVDLDLGSEELARFMSLMRSRGFRLSVEHLTYLLRALLSREQAHGRGRPAKERHKLGAARIVSDLVDQLSKDTSVGIAAPNDPSTKPLLQSLAVRQVRADSQAFALRMRRDAVLRRDPGTAEIVFQTMLDQGIRPTEHHYTALMEGYAKVGDMASAQTVMQNAKAQDGIKSSVVMHTILMDGYARLGQRDKLRKQYEAMMAEGIVPDRQALTVLAKSAAARGQPDLVRRWIVDEDPEQTPPGSPLPQRESELPSAVPAVDPSRLLESIPTPSYLALPPASDLPAIALLFQAYMLAGDPYDAHLMLSRSLAEGLQPDRRLRIVVKRSGRWIVRMLDRARRMEEGTVRGSDGPCVPLSQARPAPPHHGLPTSHANTVKSVEGSSDRTHASATFSASTSATAGLGNADLNFPMSRLPKTCSLTVEELQAALKLYEQNAAASSGPALMKRMRPGGPNEELCNRLRRRSKKSIRMLADALKPPATVSTQSRPGRAKRG